MVKFNNIQKFMAEIIPVCKVQFFLFVQYAGLINDKILTDIVRESGINHALAGKEISVMQKLSKADYRLLDALQNNTTLSQIDLAERSGMSRTSVWRRIREMEDAGLIEGRVALLNPRALGLQIHVLLSVSMVQHSDRTRKEFEEYVEDLPEVMECYSVSGDRDYLLQIISKDMESYNDFLNTMILHHPSVHSASSSFALRRVKYTTALPL